VDGADPLFARRFHQQALAQELLLRPIGNTVYLMPPYVLSDDEQDLIAERLPRVLERTLQDQPPARVAEPTLA
jgi:adenosylmethionine-8-amino-7-oxononanoate aminotransferase